ncbi:MAG: hypothetical protein IJX28_09655 [Clostridia bacterium]|nr:hypothetical protein [Clostridia bacterium]
MKSYLRMLPPLQWLSALSAVLGGILQTVCIFRYLEDGSNYFLTGAILPGIAVGLCILSLALGTVAAATTKPEQLAKTIFSNRPIRCTPTVGFLAPAIALLFYEEKKLSVLTAFFLLLAVAYALFVNTPKLRRYTVPTALLGFATVAACALLNAYFYFDVSVEMNAPIKTALQAGLLASMLYFTGELRYLLGTPRPRIFLAMCSWVVALGSLTAIAFPISYFCGEFSRADYGAGALLMLFMVMTAFAQIIRLYNPPAHDEKQPESAPDSERNPT